MNERQKMLLEAIKSRVETLLGRRYEWRQNSRQMIAEYGQSAFSEVAAAEEFGCRTKFDSVFGRPPESDGERMRFNRDLSALVKAGLVTITECGANTRFVRPIA